MPSSDTARQFAQTIEREKRRLEGVATRTIGNIADQMRVQGLRAYRNGRDPADTIPQVAQEFEPIMVDAMVAAHLRGRYRTMLIGAAAQRRNTKLANTPYDDAIAFLARRLTITDDQTEALRATYSGHALRVTGEATDQVEREVQAAVLNATREGLHVDAGTAQVQAAYESAGAGQNPYVYESVIRTQTQLAYSAGRENALQDPAIDEILWGFTYVTVGDDRVRPTHVALDGVQLPKDHPRWASITPPNGYACRCSKIEVFDRGEVQDVPEEAVVDGMRVKPGADEGWDFNPRQLFTDTMAA